MTAPPIPSLELLLAQADWVRALARRLVSDGHAADDVVQSTWLALLRRPLARSESVEALRAWLATTLRRNAHREHMETSRRAARETVAARAEALPSTLDVLEQESVRRRLVEAVLGLDEPYRSALILRYFEGLEPIEIAARSNVSASTVRSRLQRGLALMRAELERERGADWKSWCLIVLPVAKTAAIGSGVTGGALVGSKLKVAGIIALVLAGTFATWEMLDLVSRSKLPESNGASAPKLVAPFVEPSTPHDPSETGTAHADESSTRSAIIAPSESPLAADRSKLDPVGILVYGSIVDENGAVPNARKNKYPGAVSMSVRFTEDHGDDVWTQANPKGIYSQAGLHPGHWRVTTWAQGFHSTPTDLTLDVTDTTRRLDLVLRHATLVRIKIVTPEGTPLRDALKSEKGLDEMHGPVAIATSAPPNARLPETLERNHAHFGSSTYWGWGSQVSPSPVEIPASIAGILEVTDGLPAYVSITWRDIVLDTQLAAPGTEEMTFTLPVDKVRDCIGHARVHVVDALTGEPLHADGSLQERDTWGSGTRAGDNGTIEFGNLLPGLLLLRLSCTDHESITELVRIDPGTTTDLGTYRLQPGVSIEGRVIDETGQPVASALIALDAEHPMESRDWFGWSTKPDGTIRLRSMHPARYWIWAGAGESEQAGTSRAQLVDARGGDVRGLVFQLAKTTKLFVRLKSSPPWDARLRLVSKDGAPQFEGGLRDEGTMRDWSSTFALPGEYELELLSQDKVLRARHVVVGDAKLEVEL